jgi:hypothetical protein
MLNRTMRLLTLLVVVLVTTMMTTVADGETDLATRTLCTLKPDWWEIGGTSDVVACTVDCSLDLANAPLLSIP